MNQQLELTIIQNIQRTFSEATLLAMSAQERGKEAILKARECGQFLIEARENAAGKKLKTWLMSHVTPDLNLPSYETAQRWVRLAETPMEQIEQALTLRQAYIAAGILPEPHREHGTQKAHGEACKWISFIEKAWGELEKIKESSPINAWPSTQRITLKEKLRPLVQLYQTL